MKRNSAFPSDYLKPQDVPSEGLDLVIKDVIMEEFEDPETKVVKDKAVVSFDNSDKRLILNRTNWVAIETQHGEESDNWKGKTVHLVVRPVEAFGETKPAIRVG